MSTTTIMVKLNAFVSDIGYMLGFSTIVILGILAALLGLGWAVRKVQHYIVGHGQWTNSSLQNKMIASRKRW